MSFEEKLKELESVVSELEGGNLSLEESIVKFEEGMKLSKECNKILEGAEKRINVLTQSDNGIEEKEFDIAPDN
ncbi:MAG: exodeoxyribonuclease VII small subunit [Methanobacteriaceae archaeon]